MRAMIRRLSSSLRVAPGEGRVVAVLSGIFFLTAAGSSLGSNAADALLYAKFGITSLPAMFVVLGLVTVATSLAITAVLGRGARERFYVRLALGLAVAMVLMRLAMATRLPLVIPLTWLGVNVANSLQGILTWGLAGASCDTRQAKRLFPVLAAGSILGAIAGGVATRPAAQWLHSENLLLAWAASLAIAFACGLLLLRGGGVLTAPRRTSVRTEIQQGFQTVRHSPMLGWLSIAVILFALLFTCLQFPFARAATAAYPSPDSLAGFLGVFQAASTSVAFVVSLVVANRLFARVGLANAVLGFGLVYLGSFVALLVSGGFWVLVATRFVQMAYMQGVAGSAYHALFNVVPGERRDQARTFLDGVPAQLGTALAGGMLVLIQAQPASRIYVLGTAGAIGLVTALWMTRRAYGRSLLAALRSGRPSVFVPEAGPFLGIAGDADGRRVALAGLGHADPVVRRMAAEVAGHVNEAGPALTQLLADPDADVREAAIRALSGHRGVSHLIRPMVEDPEPSVRVAAAVMLARRGAADTAGAVLRGMAASLDPAERVMGLEGLAEAGLPLDDLKLILADPNPAVRRAGLKAAGRAECVAALGDRDPGVRRLAEQLVSPEEAAAAIRDAELEDGALGCLERTRVAWPQLREHAERRRDQALEYRAMAMAASQVHSAPYNLLADSLRAAARRAGLRALRAAALVGRERLTVAVDSLAGRDRVLRAGAIEAIESLGEPALVKPLIGLFEEGGDAVPPPDDWIERLRMGSDPWLVECVEFATGVQNGLKMETLSTIPLMERIVFLRQVPLFVDLEPSDLKQVAATATEQLFPASAEIARQGELGEEMYVIASGRVRVLVDGVEVSVRQAGDHVGEMAILTREPRIASLVADGEVRALTVSRPHFEAMLRERPDIGLGIITALCHRLRDVTAEVASRKG